MEIAGLVSQIIRDDKPVKVAIDVGGLGVGVYDRLIEQGHSDVVTAVNFGSKAVEPPPLDETGKPSGGNANRRAELWNNMKTALQGLHFSIPDSDSLHADLTSVGYKYDSSGRLARVKSRHAQARDAITRRSGRRCVVLLRAGRIADRAIESNRLQP
jgi:hypothetical protein